MEVGTGCCLCKACIGHSKASHCLFGVSGPQHKLRKADCVKEVL